MRKASWRPSSFGFAPGRRRLYSAAPIPGSTNRGKLTRLRPPHKDECCVTAQGWRGREETRPQDTQTRSRLIIGQNGPPDSALAASSGWRLLAAQPLTGTRRAALLGACARACVPRRYTPSDLWRRSTVVRAIWSPAAIVLSLAPSSAYSDTCT